MGKPLSSAKGNFQNDKKWDEEVEYHNFLDGKQHLVRVVGDITVLARHWIDTLTSKRFPAWCPQMNSDTEEFDSNRPCPAHDDFDDKSQKVLIGNCIVRKHQDRNEPNPMRAFSLPAAVTQDIEAIVELIKCDPADPVDGIDLAIKYDKSAVGNKKWSVHRGDKTPLTDEEKDYELYDFDALCPDFNDPEVVAEYAKNMKESMARNKYYVVQDQAVPSGARDPFKFFKGTSNGKPWTDFAVLVEYKNEKLGDKAKKHTVTETTTKPAAEIAEEPEDEPPPPKETAEPAPKPELVPDEPAPEPAQARTEPAEEKTPSNAHPDSSIGTKEHPEHGIVPECFEAYDGTAKCQRCPMRATCIVSTDDDGDL